MGQQVPLGNRLEFAGLLYQTGVLVLGFVEQHRDLAAVGDQRLDLHRLHLLLDGIDEVLSIDFDLRVRDDIDAGFTCNQGSLVFLLFQFFGVLF